MVLEEWFEVRVKWVEEIRLEEGSLRRLRFSLSSFEDVVTRFRFFLIRGFMGGFDGGGLVVVW